MKNVIFKIGIHMAFWNRKLLDELHNKTKEVIMNEILIRLSGSNANYMEYEIQADKIAPNWFSESICQKKKLKVRFLWRLH